MDTSKHYNNKRHSNNALKNYALGLLIIIIFLISQSLIAQVGIGTTSPDASSILDITSTEAGMLVPRMTQTDRNNIGTPATGLLIYQTNNTPGFYFYDGSVWVGIGVGNKNTLDEAYDQGGAGIGRTITADNGAVEIISNNANNSGLIVSNEEENPIAASLTARSIDVNSDPTAISATASGIHGDITAINASITGEPSAFGYFGTTITNYGIKSIVTDSNPDANLITNYGVFSHAEYGHVNWAGYFGNPNRPSQLNGNVYIKDNLYVDRGLVYRPNGAATTIGNILQYTDTNGSLEAIDPSTIFTQNTLDQAYDQGGAGSGSTIDATDGVVTIAGEDGLLVTGTHGSGDDVLISGAGTRMFFNPKKAAFRAGYANGIEWDNVNIGNYSIAMGVNTTASGNSSTVMGYNSTAIGSYSTAMGAFTQASGLASTAMGNTSIASGDNSTAMGSLTEASGLESTAMGNSSIASGLNSIAMGRNAEATGSYSIAMGLHTQAPSFSETSLGSYSTTYTPISATNSENLDRIFSIGNGADELNRSNALIIYKSGLMNINDEYDMPLIDGNTNQVMATDGAGHVNFVDATSIFTDTDHQNISGSGLSGTDLTIGIENGTPETVDLSTLKDHDWYQTTTTTQATDIAQSIFTNGKVGIGENNPDGFLEVTANNTATEPNLNLVDIGNSGARINFTNTGTTNGNTWTLFGDTNDTDANSVFNIYHSNTGNIIQIRGNGDVGFGGVPDANSHVFHGTNAGNDGFKIESTGANGNYWRMYTVNSSGNLNLFSRLNGNTTVGNFNDASGVYSATSDRRLKKDFKPLPFSWENFMQLETLSYLYKVQKDDKRSLGLIAQDVELIYPELVSYNTESDVYHLNYSGFGVIAIKAVQELKEEVNTLKTENAVLKAKLNQLESLEARLNALENKTESLEKFVSTEN